MQEEEQVIHEILRILGTPERGGGATYSLYFGDQFGEPLFAVGLDNRFTAYPEPESLREKLRLFLKQYRDLWKHPRCCIGIWQGLNEAGEEEAFLDVTVLVYNEAIARRFAEDGNQIAIFDLGSGTEIDTGGSGLPVQDAPSPEERLEWLDSQDRLGTMGDTDRVK
jgi:hypothetical protein